MRRRLLYSAVVMVLLLGAGELAARLFVRGGTFLVPDLRLGYCNRAGFRGSWRGLTRRVSVRIDAEGIRVPWRSPGEGECDLRILCLGDSCTFGFDVEAEEAYPHLLQERIRKSNPTLRVEVLNAGVIGYSTRHGSRQFQESLLKHRPDIVTVAFNVANRIVRLPSTDTLENPTFFGSELLVGMTRGSALLQWIYDLGLRGPLASRSSDMGWDPEYRQEKDPMFGSKAQILAGFEGYSPFVTEEEHTRELTGLVDLAHENGIEVLFLSFGENPLVGGALEDGERLLEFGRPEDAVDSIERYFEQDKSDLRYQNNLDVLANHLLEVARRHIGMDLSHADLRFPSIRADLRGVVLRTHRAYVERMEEISRRTEAVHLDLRSNMSDSALFLDFVHFNAKGHEIVARVTHEALRQNGWLTAR